MTSITGVDQIISLNICPADKLGDLGFRDLDLTTDKVHCVLTDREHDKTDISNVNIGDTDTNKD